MSLEGKWEELSEGQKAKLKACTTPEEIISLAREEGYELNDDELEAVAGGWGCFDDAGCPFFS